MGNIDILQIPTLKFHLTQSFRQNIQIIQMSQIELLNHIENEIDLNPVIIKKKPATSFIDLNISKPKSLYEDLMEQAACILSKEEQKTAKYIFGNLSDEGFLLNIAITPKMHSILKKIQTLEPAGICALSLKEALLIQLERQDKKDVLAYKIIEQFFDDFLHRKWKKIANYFQVTILEIKNIIASDLAQLNLRPAEKYQAKKTVYPLIDMYIQEIDDSLHVSLNQSFFPSIGIVDNIKNNKEKVNKIYKKKALDLIENLYKRDSLLLSIGKYIIKKEAQFFLYNGQMQLLSAAELAKFCNVHKSTIHRCISNKYLIYSNNIMPLKIFFKGHEIPQNNLLNNIKEVIVNEDKKKPLSDLKIVQELQEQGIDISRRTVAKYREKLKIPTASLRKSLQ